MSLLRIRRERKEQSTGPYKPPKLRKLLVGLVLVLLAIWYLSTYL
jgi:hypothetical protein